MLTLRIYMIVFNMRSKFQCHVFVTAVSRVCFNLSTHSHFFAHWCHVICHVRIHSSACSELPCEEIS